MLYVSDKFLLAEKRKLRILFCSMRVLLVLTSDAKFAN